MDIINAESKLTVVKEESSDFTKVEESDSVTKEENALNKNVVCIDSKMDFVSDFTSGESRMPVALPLVKSEAVEMEVCKVEPKCGVLCTVKLEEEKPLELMKVKLEPDEAVTFEAKNENMPAPFDFIAVNQQEEEFHDAVSVKEELDLEEGTQVSQSIESVTGVQNNGMQCQQMGNDCNDTFPRDEDMVSSADKRTFVDSVVTKSMALELFKCELCDKYLSNSCALKRHLRNHTDVKNFKCNVCGKDYVKSETLKEHLRTHSGQKPSKCEVCGKKFVKLENLKVHLRSHTGEKPYKCSVCGKNFVQAGHLNSHYRTHTGEKPFKCHFCGKDFGQSGHLNMHLRIHTGEKPHKCLICAKRFGQIENLKSHFQIHTGQKPFKCHICGKCFVRSQNLKLHHRIHTGEKPFQCDVCSKSFVRFGILKKHLQKKHTRE